MKHYGYNDDDFNYYEEDRDTSPHKNIAEVIKCHIVKIKTANLYTGNNLILSISS